MIVRRATHNTVTSLYWLLVDVFNFPDILRRVRKEAEDCLLDEPTNGIPIFDIARLVRQPYLQAVYAETLRLRTHGVVVRNPRESVKISKWRIPGGSFGATCSTTAHMNEEVWSTKERGSHPVGKFAPDRFLIYSDQDLEATFSLSGLEGSWIPFGGGIWACPGRLFAKQQTIVTLAILATMFDIDILATEADLQMSSKRFGFGVLEPQGKSPFRVARRVV